MQSNLIRGKTDSTLVQFFRYGFVGGVAFVFDFLTLFALTAYGEIYYLHAAALAFVVGVAVNYVLSTAWVFQKHSLGNRSLEFAIFLFLGVIGLGLNHVLMCGLTELASCHYLFSKALSTGMVFLWNFASRKCLLFRRQATLLIAAEPAAIDTVRDPDGELRGAFETTSPAHAF